MQAMKVRVAVVQDAPVMFDPERTIAKVGDLLAAAAQEGAEVVLFPEAFVGGYPKGLDFGVRLGSRTAEGRDWFARYHASAIEAPGPLADRLGGLARAHRVHLVIGVVERSGGTLYCSVLFFSPDGRMIGKHRKLMPTALERVVWGTGDGSTLPVLDTPVGKIGAVICWENYMPLLRTAMYAKGIELYCAPTVDDRETWLPSMRHVALEGRCFVLTASQLLRRSDCPPDYPASFPAPDAPLIRGGSAIVGPLGEVLAGPVFDRPAILTAEIDRGQIARAKFDLDVVGHYARPARGRRPGSPADSRCAGGAATR